MGTDQLGEKRTKAGFWKPPAEPVIGFLGHASRFVGWGPGPTWEARS